MSKFGRKIAAAGTSALAVVALSACTQESPDTVYEDQAADTRATESTLDDQTYANETESTAMDTETSTMDSRTPTMGDDMGDDTAMSAATRDEARRVATSLGVSELNEIENWKITNAGEELGEIDRLGVDRQTGEILAVVGLEGVVGVNMKEVAIPLKDLTKEGDETLTTDLSMDELQQQRDIDPWDDSEALTENATQ
jgi:PRC-barrel domain